MEILLGLVTGVLGFIVVYCSLGGLYTINQNERAVITNFGRADQSGRQTSLELPIAQRFRPEEKELYVYPQVRVIGPEGGRN